MPFPSNPNPVALEELAAYRLAVHPYDAQEVERIVRGAIAALEDALKRGQSVSLGDAGVIEVGERPGRKVQPNFPNGKAEAKMIGPRRAVRLRLSKGLQRRMNKVYRRELLVKGGNDAEDS